MHQNKSAVHDTAYRPDLDGLRAIAVLAVVAYHAFPSVAPGGFLGVDIFFVLSGFFITKSILDQQAIGTFTFSAFYIRRARRIFPALVAVLLGTLLLGAAILLADEYEQLGGHAAAAAVFLSNFAFWREVGYFDNAAPLKPLLHLWSLAIEEQFYLFWPLMLWGAFRLRVAPIWLIALLTAASFAVCVLSPDPAAAFYSPLSRAWELGVGAAAAWFIRLDVRIISIWRITLALAGAIMVCASLRFMNATMPLPGPLSLIPTVATAMLIVAGRDTPVAKWFLGLAPMVWIGLISFELYLVHWPLLSFATILAGDTPSIPTRSMVVLASFVIAWLIYQWVEKPLRFGAHGKTKAAALMGGLAVVVLSGVGVVAGGGFPSRYGDATSAMAPFAWEDSWGFQDSCVARFKFQVQCLETSPGAPNDAVLVGDSHAHHYFAGLSAHFEAAGKNLLLGGAGGCVPFYNTQSAGVGYEDACMAAVNEALDYAMSSPSVKTVYLASRGPMYLTGKGYGEIDPNDRFIRSISHPEFNDNFPAVFEAAMSETLTRLAAAGKQAVFILDVPELGFDPRSCVAIRPISWLMRRSPCGLPRAAVDERNSEYRALVHRVISNFPNALAYDASGPLCDDQTCWAGMDGVMLYRNDDHLNDAGSRLIANDLFLNTARTPPSS